MSPVPIISMMKTRTVKSESSGNHFFLIVVTKFRSCASTIIFTSSVASDIPFVVEHDEMKIEVIFGYVIMHWKEFVLAILARTFRYVAWKMRDSLHHSIDLRIITTT